VFNRGVRRIATTALLVGLLAAGCGGGGSGSTQQAGTTVQSAPPVTATETVATAKTTSTAASRSIVGATSTHSTELKPTGGYTCNGKRLRALSATGPVKVEPPVVKPGQSFSVVVTDRRAKVAHVTLTGVASTPITADAVGADEGLAARLKMPGDASCGNKLLEIEGDVSAEAYVGVSR
jgi:hypothetical protein